MENSMIIGLLFMFIITAFTNILSTLKTIFISKDIMNPVYFLVFLDAVIFATIVSKVTSSDGIAYTIAFALGKSMGVFLGGKIESKLALGICEVDLFLNDSIKASQIAQKIRETGYTVNNILVGGNNETERHQIEVVINRKEIKVLEDIIKGFDVEKPTLKVKTLNKVDGKITTTRLRRA
ncbi:MAG: DUF5698 domain-containing protein [Tissierella sp.]|uniref:DUF5698 domain-containing protein n=1 Tax=Tissierella sp. TaxID=41274 RepID=UPI003F9B2E05